MSAEANRDIAERDRKVLSDRYAQRLDCPTCRGTGKHPDMAGFDCDNCNGWGLLLPPNKS